MLVSYKWLKELVDVDVTTYELSEKCQQQGLKSKVFQHRLKA